jgi:cytochrome c-type biogenesis protein CcmE
MKPRHQRLIFISVSVACLCISVLAVMRAFRENLVFFYSPGDVKTRTIEAGRIVRVGGLVEVGSVERNGDDTMFVITDGSDTLRARYHGMMPSLFREGHGVVAEGTLEDGTLRARMILAKHDEKYMPREVVDSLKRNGRWKGAAAAQGNAAP